MAQQLTGRVQHFPGAGPAGFGHGPLLKAGACVAVVSFVIRKRFSLQLALPCSSGQCKETELQGVSPILLPVPDQRCRVPEQLLHCLPCRACYRTGM